MKSFYDAIYLSPHLDDAILSCGGQIYQLTQAGGSALIVSIMTGDAPSEVLSPFAQSLHDRWRLAANASAIRRAEDQAAAKVVGADCLHLGFLDCIYRKHPASEVALYDSEEALFGELHPAEDALAQSLAKTFGRLPDSDQVLAPLTVGNHVDHQLVRLSAELWRRSSTLDYYEEFPYVLSPNALPNEVDHNGSWGTSVVKLSSQALAARIQAIACYHSQLSTFFEDQKALERSVTDYVQEVGGERLWHRIVL